MISVTLTIIKVKNLVNLIFLYNLIDNNLINLNNIYLNLFNQIIYLTKLLLGIIGQNIGRVLFHRKLLS